VTCQRCPRRDPDAHHEPHDPARQHCLYGHLGICNALDISDCHHVRINHSKLFAVHDNHINGIENFWNQAKRHMRKFNGVPNRDSTYSSRNANGASTEDHHGNY
jgi:hypothetical protein